MNYLHMANVHQDQGDFIVTRLVVQRREAVFRFSYDKLKVVPLFMILEAVFQSAGKAYRSYHKTPTGPVTGAVIVSYSKMNFTRPLFAEETILIKTQFSSKIESSNISLFKLQIYAESLDSEPIVKDCQLLTQTTKQIAFDLNMTGDKQLEELKNQYFFENILV